MCILDEATHSASIPSSAAEAPSDEEANIVHRHRPLRYMRSQPLRKRSLHTSYTNVQALGTSPKLADVDFALIVIIVIVIIVSSAGSSRHEGQLCGSRRRKLEQARPPCARKSSSATTTRQE